MFALFQIGLMPMTCSEIGNPQLYHIPNFLMDVICLIMKLELFNII